MDLDDEELEATRKLNGVSKSKDGKILEKYIDLIKKGYCEDCNELNCIDNYPHRQIAQAIENILKERQADKEKIKELEEKETIKCQK